QETKCPDDAFPLKRFNRLGYNHIALNGQKGYHGVAIVSRHPFETTGFRDFCGKTDCRHISVVLGERARLREPIKLHNFYVPAGGDEPDAEINPKFGHKLSFLDEMRDCDELRPARKERAILVGDLNVAPLEHDVWSHKQMIKVVSHTPVECEKLNLARRAGAWVDSMRVHTPEPQKLYTCGATGRWTIGARPIAAGGSITSGRPMRLAIVSPPSRSPRTIAAPNGLPITRRSRRRSKRNFQTKPQ